MISYPLAVEEQGVVVALSRVDFAALEWEPVVTSVRAHVFESVIDSDLGLPADLAVVERIRTAGSHLCPNVEEVLAANRLECVLYEPLPFSCRVSASR